jgi:hypothetical protein
VALLDRRDHLLMGNDDITQLATPRRAIPNEDPEIARLSAMVLALLGELTVTRERLDTLERLLASARVLQQADIEAYQPDPAATAERDRLRQRQIAKVMRPLRIDAEKAVANMQRSLAEADAVLAEELDP